MNRKYRVLIVDDDRVNLKIIKEILEGSYILAFAETGEKALDVLPVFKPDLILLDIMMPGIDGYEVTRRIKADEQYRFIKIILVSGKAMVNERLEGYNSGADDYLTKPFVDDELEAKVKVFLRLKNAEEIDQVKSDLLNLISHETRTPLNAIIGISELLENDKSINEDIKKKLEIVSKSGYRLLDFLNKVETLISIKKGIDLNKTYENINFYLKAAVTALEKEARNKEIKFEFTVDDNLSWSLDWDTFCSVLEYILDNAVKFSPVGGAVKIKAENKNDVFILEISDQGEGIKEEWLDKVFDEFSISDINHHHKGQGLSLAIARYIVELHGGTIKASSTPGKGAVFSMRIPE
ncbi:MAG: hybrid sensor histidine kinase/response regulator [bacterium]|nr:hybrid sensor histidine kinase/response regulator [bacterium]